MNVRREVLVSAGAMGAMVTVAGLAWSHLPPRLVVRWDIHGDPAGSLDRLPALLIVPAICLVITAVFALAPAAMPARSRLERSAIAWTSIWMVVLGNMLFSQFILVAANLGLPLDVPRSSALYAAMVMFVTGNWLGKVRYNFLLGIRTPWTLADETVWDKTHRFAGRLWVLAAAAVVIAAFALPAGRSSNPVLFVIMTVAVVGPALAGVVYSALVSPPSRTAA